jgi:hypothetical protein
MDSANHANLPPNKSFWLFLECEIAMTVQPSEDVL